MNIREYSELFRYLMEQRCLLPESLVFVEDIVDWCKENGVPETDGEMPFKLVSRNGLGCLMLVKEEVPERVIDERIRAMTIRDQLDNAAVDRGDKLNSIQKKLAYLFLREYAVSLPDVGTDDILADNWTFTEMERLGYFRT
jgi:hypothetical protein